MLLLLPLLLKLRKQWIERRGTKRLVRAVNKEEIGTNTVSVAKDYRKLYKLLERAVVWQSRCHRNAMLLCVSVL